MFQTVYHHDALGDLTLASNGEAITGLWLEGQKYFGGTVDEEMKRDDALAAFKPAFDWLDAYFAGQPQPVSVLSLAPNGSAFRQEVWRALADIPYGELRSYGELAQLVAKKMGKETWSARATGGAVGHNPISIILPCHRVVGSTGSITGYAGGIKRKMWLLEHEGIDLSKLTIPTKGTAL